jgi:hypothetical protein
MSQACSILRIVVIFVYMSIRRFLETSTDVDGGSQRYEWNLAKERGAVAGRRSATPPSSLSASGRARVSSALRPEDETWDETYDSSSSLIVN